MVIGMVTIRRRGVRSGEDGVGSGEKEKESDHCFQCLFSRSQWEKVGI